MKVNSQYWLGEAKIVHSSNKGPSMLDCTVLLPVSQTWDLLALVRVGHLLPGMAMLVLSSKEDELYINE